ncbi:helix-hairpin-helix domain-containing protein [Glycomyces buryatensis]|uniref:ComEA family DNA-binding protein n=1 Tax=Glycomyces buryatensis TaxID=2570927 RepID=A0A4S8QC35_9ACTN|nr:helix-hairpin-helix domain-containing protein [Glycomyces buryatensis]THV41141.1 ComEA family DNA-binding protein [Glycomyces buryatensis]
MERRNQIEPAALAARLRLKLDQADAPPPRDPVCRETVDASDGEIAAEPDVEPERTSVDDSPVRSGVADRAEKLQARLGLSHVNRWVLAGVAIVVAAVGLSVTVLSWPKTEPAATVPAAPVETAAAPEMIVVSVAGAVNEPGIVELESGARVADAIEAAGGLAEGADPGFLNLARVVADGDLVAVTETEAAPGGEAATGEGETGGGASAGNLVNINVADATALDALKGIGPVLAERIVTYREDNGSFQSVDELTEVSGIGPALLEQIRDQVTL